MTRNAAASLSAGLPAVTRPSLLSRIVSAIAREIRLRRDMRLLGSLDDAALHDLGLVRSGVEDVVRHGRAYTKGPMTFDQPLPDATATITPLNLTEWR
ncbi:DUF1127 domain-containing protein [Microvirga sp. c23x22]|uniref:DUF1127 domain-containing protein n=2 Tax=Microvirga terricola TaxID=2719797 RepID=A0ABX0V7Z9_9HYPH|nr:DUF1127 domain-containing protein [Microvirga terricola]